MTKDRDRSPSHIEVSDLLRLAALAAEAEAELFGRHPRGSGRYAGRLLGRALCQGAALRYVDGKNGVKDFDVWSFYAQDDDWPFPSRWRGTRDFGPSKFGRYPADPPRYRQARRPSRPLAAGRARHRSSPRHPRLPGRRTQNDAGQRQYRRAHRRPAHTDDDSSRSDPELVIHSSRSGGWPRMTASTQTANLIDQLRSQGISLIYDPAAKTLRTDTEDTVAVSVG